MYTDRCSGERCFWMSLNFSRKSSKEFRYVLSETSSDLHFTTVITSFGRSPKLGRYWFTLMPRFSLRRSRSHLFKNRISCVFASSFEAQIEVHRIIESSKRFTLWSSSKRWSKTDTGDTKPNQRLSNINLLWNLQNIQKMITFTLSKYGSHALRW